MGFEHPHDGALKGIELARPLDRGALAEVIFLDPLGDGAWIESQLPCNLSGFEALLLIAVLDPGEELKIDHERSPAMRLKICPRDMG